MGTGGREGGLFTKKGLLILGSVITIIVCGWHAFGKLKNQGGGSVRETILEDRRARKLKAPYGKGKRPLYPNLDRPEKQNRPRSRENVNWDEIKQKTEAAVKSGELTREEADAKYREIRERMATNNKSARNGDRRVQGGTRK